MEQNKFSLPLKFKPEEVEDYLRTRQCVVVSFFGKSPFSLKSNKGSFIDQVLGRSVFAERETDSVTEPEVEPSVDCYYCPDRDCIFLHMRSWQDTFSLAQKCKEAEELLETKGILSFWSSRRYEHARSLLALFHLSHILVCCTPGHTFDISYVHLFKSLDNLRNKIQPAVSEVVRSVAGLPRDWLHHGRPAPPRVLFLFMSCPASLRGSRGLRDERKDAKPHKQPPIKRLEYSLEDQIYRILRKARIITNVAANSLFAVPGNQEFVYVETGRHGTEMDQQANLINNCLSLLSVGDYNEDSLVDQGPFYSQFLTEDQKDKRCFSNFLRDHINVGFERGFLDNISKHGTNNRDVHFELAGLGEWLEVADKMFRLFTEELTSDEGQPHSEAMMTLRDDMEIEVMFSELRCKKILPSAVSAYKDGLPPHYTAEYHSAKLLQAMSVYSMQARGPASAKFAEFLATECTSYWQSGRQRCEELSLTGDITPCLAITDSLLCLGNNCTNRRHVTRDQGQEAPKEGDKKVLPSMSCTSGVQYIAACNCGRRQANREDPFKLVDANYNFYQQLEEECCKDLEHVTFPVYQAQPIPATASLVPTEKIKLEVKELKEDSEESPEHRTKQEAVPEVKVEDTMARVETPAEDDAEIILEVLENLHIDGKSPSKVASLLSRASSQVEFLTSMKTLTSSPGLKPEFPSWSLVMLGSSHVYSHSAGLAAQPGFMSSSKFLLPWEISLTKVSAADLEARWPNVLESAAKRASLRGAGETQDNRITVKVFVGFEYECPRGHRFMISAPDRPMKSSSTMREAATRLVGSDLPLYMACPCRISKPPLAQLTRIHLVTPKAPIWVTLNPQVQPSPGGPVFVPGWEAPHKLPPNSYWVLRLPYVYWGEGGAHLPPSSPPAPGSPAPRLIKGAVSFDEDFTDG